ncbi:DUF2341 domain-containing protein [bacterium]|nr:DUF2341 domain-containing protein [bacterium]
MKTKGEIVVRILSMFCGCVLLNLILIYPSKMCFGENYIQEISVNNEQNPDALFNYQILITLTPENFDYSSSTINGRDIRFYDQIGETYLPYWIETWEVDNNSMIHVKLPIIPANANVLLFLSYGDTTRQSEANGDNVFDFFDDFEGFELNLDKWNIIENEGLILVEEGMLVLKRPVGGNLINIESFLTLTGAKIIEYEQMYSPSDYYYSSVYYGSSPNISSIGYSILAFESYEYESALYTGEVKIAPRCRAHSSTEGDIIVDPPPITLFKEKFIVSDGYLQRVLNDMPNEISTRYHGVSSGKIGMHTSSTDSTWNFDTKTWTDYIFVRKYSSLEPIVSLGEVLYVSSQEENEQIYNYNLDYDSNNEGSADILDIKNLITKGRFSFNSFNYPNPFNAQTSINFYLPVEMHASLKIIDIRGRQIRFLYENEHGVLGNHSIVWDGKNDQGKLVESGVYFSVINTNNAYSEINQVILLK